MLSRNCLKFYTSLRNKKYRDLHGKFLAEGEKIVTDILGFSQSNIKIITLLANKEFLQQTDPKNLSPEIEVIEVKDHELERISTLSAPNKAILLCLKPDFIPDYKKISVELSVYLEDIRDPGNLGTIIRTADWFGIRHIFCTRESVDLYNPKVIQASMGAICKVKIYYEDFTTVFSETEKSPGYKIIGTTLDGQNLFKEVLPETGLIVFGNESRGISPEVISMLDLKHTIPAFTGKTEGSESLNISSAVSIVLAEYRRRIYSK
jgi:TrmH family RNA methyltransferase